MKFSALSLLCLMACLCASAGAQTRHDPLNPREADQLRDSAQEPKKRIDLLISFARERMLAIERLRGAPHPSTTQPGLDNSGKIADLLADLAALIDELDDNLEMCEEHHADLRRPLHHVLDAEADFLQKLEALRNSATELDKRRLGAALEDASDSVKSSSEGARAMLAKQEGEEKRKPDHQEGK